MSKSDRNDDIASQSPSSLRQRVLSAIIGVPLVVAGLVVFDLRPIPDYFAVGGLAVLLVAIGYELRVVIPTNTVTALALIGLPSLGLVILPALMNKPTLLATLVDLGILWIVVWFFLLMYERRGRRVFANLAFRCAVCYLYVLIGGASLYLIFDQYGSIGVLTLLGFAWSIDTGAYLVGKRFGKEPMAPQISPGKTKEGLYGGIAFGLIVGGVIVSVSYPMGFKLAWQYSVIIPILIAAAIFGDLAVSALKRATSVKDTGSFIRGHGGLMDRLDSVLPVATLFVIGTTTMSHWVVVGNH